VLTFALVPCLERVRTVIGEPKVIVNRRWGPNLSVAHSVTSGWVCYMLRATLIAVDGMLMHVSAGNPARYRKLYCIGLLLVDLYAIAPALFCQITGGVGSAERLHDLGHFLVQIEHTNAHAHCKGALPAHESVLRDPFADRFG